MPRFHSIMGIGLAAVVLVLGVSDLSARPSLAATSTALCPPTHIPTATPIRTPGVIENHIRDLQSQYQSTGLLNRSRVRAELNAARSEVSAGSTTTHAP